MGLFGLNEKTVAKMEAKRDIKGLINALNDKHRGVPTRAAKALGQIKDARAVEPLVKALEDENMHFRRQVVVYSRIPALFRGEFYSPSSPPETQPSH